jgi:hypothetical protein
MSRVAPTTIWEEPDARKSTSRWVPLYPTLAGGRWYPSTAAADQDGTFTLRDGRLFLDREVVASGRMIAAGNRRTVGFPTLPASQVLAAYEPPNPVASFTRATTATYVEEV